MSYYDQKPPAVGTVAAPPPGYPLQGAYPQPGAYPPPPPQYAPPPQTVVVTQPVQERDSGCCGCLTACLAGFCCCCALDMCCL